MGPVHVPMDFRGSCGKIVSVADVEAEEHRQGGKFELLAHKYDILKPKQRHQLLAQLKKQKE